MLSMLLGSPAPVSGAPPPSQAPLPPPGEMARCKELIDAGLVAAARSRLEPIVEQHPRWARALALLGLTYYKENRFEPARDLFARALEADPEEIAARPYYGWTLYSLGELDAAAAMFESLLRRKPDYAAAAFALGVIALDRDDLAASRRHLERALRLALEQGDRETEGRARGRLGALHLRRGELEAAERELERAVELAPDDGEAAFKLGRARELRASRREPPAGDRVAGGPIDTAHPAGTAGAAALRLVEVPGAAGVDLVMTSGEMPSGEILEVDGGGIALFDFDRDGDLDLFLANGATLDDPERGPGSRLYANQGDGTFLDMTRAVGLDLTRWAMGVAVGDYDGDGWEDLYVTCYGPNVLLRNVGAGGGRRLVDVARAAGVANDGWSTGAAFSDLDRDGDLDLFVVNYLAFDWRRPPARAGGAFKGLSVMAGPRGLDGQPDALYENLGDGRFRDVTAAAGLAAPAAEAYGLGVRVLDFDGDGRLDVFVGNDSTADRLWFQRGDLEFVEGAAAAGVAANGAGTTQATMGLCVLDADANGWPDLFLTVFSDDTNTLHLNFGDGFFDDRSAQYGLAAPSRPLLGWGCGAYDFDSDGDEDLYIANGHVYPEMGRPDVGSSWAQRPALFERRGARFEPAPCAAAWCERAVHGRATAFGDIDGDRDVDVLMTTLNGPLHVLRNESSGGRSLVVRPRAAAGSVVAVESPAGVQRRWLAGGGSFQSADAAEAYFGVAGAPAGAGVEVTLRPPAGAVRRFRAVPIDRRLVVP